MPTGDADMDHPATLEYDAATRGERAAVRYRAGRLVATWLFVLGFVSLALGQGALAESPVPWPVHAWLTLTMVVAPLVAGAFAWREHAVAKPGYLDLQTFAVCCFAFFGCAAVWSALQWLGVVD